MNNNYQTSISAEAIEQIIETYPDGNKKCAEYYLNGELVGTRSFHACGALEFETPFKAGVRHGYEYRWDIPGQLLSAEPYQNGLVHGIAKQWSDDGKLIGTYQMHHGTGIDLWWCEAREDNAIYLIEVHYIKDGEPHGFEWWINQDQKSVYIENHWRNGEFHGIERRWNSQGRLRRGYPRYHINGERVNKQRYLKQCLIDDTLPRFRLEDNNPTRTFPDEIVKKKLGSSEARLRAKEFLNIK